MCKALRTHFGKIALYCRILKESRQGFYRYLSRRERPGKRRGLAEAMREIHDGDVCNDTRGRKRMYQAPLLKQPEGAAIPSVRTVYRVMKEIGLVQFGYFDLFFAFSRPKTKIMRKSAQLDATPTLA